MTDDQITGALATARRALADAVAGLDVSIAGAGTAIGLVETFGVLKRLAAAGEAIAAGRVAVLGGWEPSGARSAADWLARIGGGPVSPARAAIDVAGRLDRTPLSAVAFRSGELSVAQADAVTGAAVADPSSERRLLEMSTHGSLQKLRDEAARVRAAADADPEGRRRRIHGGRFWRRWTDGEGARCGSYRLTPADGARLEAAAQPFVDAAFDDARREGRREPAEAYAADGLVAMADVVLAGDLAGGQPALPRGPRGRTRTSRRRELIGIVNLESLRRGSVEPGETCEIAGVGPVAVETARELFGDAILRVVVRDGVDIRTVVHTGRNASALQETAVIVRQRGRCARPTCDLPIDEIDHTADYATAGAATLDGLRGFCGRDHDLKTRGRHGYRVGPNGLEWRRPDGVIEHEHPPP